MYISSSFRADSYSVSSVSPKRPESVLCASRSFSPSCTQPVAHTHCMCIHIHIYNWIYVYVYVYVYIYVCIYIKQYICIESVLFASRSASPSCAYILNVHIYIY